jgi:hypothetical protein
MSPPYPGLFATCFMLVGLFLNPENGDDAILRNVDRLQTGHMACSYCAHLAYPVGAGRELAED